MITTVGDPHYDENNRYMIPSPDEGQEGETDETDRCR